MKLTKQFFKILASVFLIFIAYQMFVPRDYHYYRYENVERDTLPIEGSAAVSISLVGESRKFHGVPKKNIEKGPYEIRIAVFGRPKDRAGMGYKWILVHDVKAVEKIEVFSADNKLLYESAGAKLKLLDQRFMAYRHFGLDVEYKKIKIVTTFRIGEGSEEKIQKVESYFLPRYSFYRMTFFNGVLEPIWKLVTGTYSVRRSTAPLGQ